MNESYVGLCADCQCMRRIESTRGSTFYLCQRSATDPKLPKYPRLPVIQCSGYERKVKADSEARISTDPPAEG